MMFGAAVCIALSIGLATIWARAAPRHWRGESRLSGEQAPPWFPFGEPVWRGVVRSYVAWTPLVVLMFGGGAVGALSDESSAAYDAGMAVASVSLLLGAAVHSAILFFNRPRFLVPPGLRDEPGALEAWRRQRRRARRYRA